jgi:hypothetical protein
MKLTTTISLCLASYAAAQTIKLNAPDAPAQGTQTIDGAFQSYSIELASFPQLAGNLSFVNRLPHNTVRMLTTNQESQ